MRAKEAYALWHRDIKNLSRVDRYTLGARVDETFFTLLETIFRACFAHDKFEKLSLVSHSIGLCDLVKFSLQLAWEEKLLDHKKYATLTPLLDDVGRMLGGWKKSLTEKTSAP